MRKVEFVIFWILIMSSLISQESKRVVENVLPKEIIEILWRDGSIQNTSLKKDKVVLKLTPDTDLARKIASDINLGQYPIVIENLFIYKKQNTEKKNTIDKASRIIRNISMLEGLEYYSNSKKKNRILYEKSYVVNDISSRKKIPDPLEGSAEGLSITVLQKDPVFGENLYSYNYLQNLDSVAFISQNINALSYTAFRVFDPKELVVHLIIQDFEDFILVYALTCADMISIPGLENKIVLSFSTRAQAVYNWFIYQYEHN